MPGFGAEGQSAGPGEGPQCDEPSAGHGTDSIQAALWSCENREGPGGWKAATPAKKTAKGQYSLRCSGTT